MEQLLSEISPQILLVILTLNVVLIFIFMLMTLSNRAKTRRLEIKYGKFMSGLTGANIEELLEDCLNRVHDVKDKNKEIEMRINSIERHLISCVQKIGVVRFNAFDNVGSDLSFSIALLDDRDDGIVLSGIYSRDSSSTYAKPVVGGKSRYPLSAEELQALDIARKTYREKTM